MPDVLQKICSMPKDFYSQQNKSMSQLFRESGYLENSNLVTKDALLIYLSTRPDLMEAWEYYSSDKRVSRGWYFTKSEDGWVVGYISTPGKEQRHKYTSKHEACSEFILHELLEFAEDEARQ